MKTRKVIQAFLEGQPGMQVYFEREMLQLYEKANNRAKRQAIRAGKESFGADDVAAHLEPLLSKTFAKVRLEYISLNEYEAQKARIHDWAPAEECSAETVSKFAAIQQVLLYCVMDGAREQAVIALQKECERYQRHLRRSVGCREYRPSGQSFQEEWELTLRQGSTRKTRIVESKYNAVANLQRILYQKDKDPLKKVSEFSKALGEKQSTLKSHRDRFAKRFLMGVGIVLTGVMPGLIALAVKSKMSSRKTFAFWQSHGEQSVERMQSRMGR